MTLQDTRFGGINHLALVCQDMQRTVDFYQGVLGMPLIKTIELPRGMGQHFFFDCGGGDCVEFFWFADAPAAAPGIASPHIAAVGASAVDGGGTCAQPSAPTTTDMTHRRMRRI